MAEDKPLSEGEVGDLDLHHGGLFFDVWVKMRVRMRTRTRTRTGTGHGGLVGSISGCRVV